MNAASPPRTVSSRGDLTTGPIASTLLIFSLPTLGSNILQSLNGTINTIWIGHFLGEAALAATSNTNIIMFLLFGAVFGFGMASTILVGQSFGRGDVDAARRAVGTSIGMLIVGALLIGGLGWYYAPDLLAMMGTPAAAMPLALDYLRVVLLSFPSVMILVVLMMALRGVGDSMTPLWFMGLAVILDAGLNPVFILGLGPAPALGIAGSATATVIANGVAVIAMIVYIYARDLAIRLRGPEWRYLWPDSALLGKILAKGLPMGAQMLVISGSSLAIIGLINREGVDTVAAFGVVMQLWNYVQMPVMAIGASVSAMAAQNIGAGRWDRIGPIARAGTGFGLAITAAVVVVIVLLDRPLLALFDLGAASPATGLAENMLLLASWGFVLFAITMVVLSVVRANGAVLGPLLIFAVALFPVRIGFAVAMRPWLGADALWWSFPAGSIVAALLSVIYYRYGKWREIRLLDQPDPEEAREQAMAGCEPTGRLHPTG
ncbi:MAG: MATE family efflux transporter [Sphingomonadaceae bacterium]|nr:MATE family efflux transporter [Sphingomonadaceae bacterium]